MNVRDAISHGAVLLFLVLAAHQAAKPLHLDNMDFPAVAEATAHSGKPVYYRGEENRLHSGLYHPPLYIYTLAAWFRLFGFGPAQARMFGALCALLQGWLALQILSLLFGSERVRQWSWLFWPLFLLNPYTLQGSAIADIDSTIYGPLLSLVLFSALRISWQDGRRRQDEPPRLGVRARGARPDGRSLGQADDGSAALPLPLSTLRSSPGLETGGCRHPRSLGRRPGSLRADLLALWRVYGLGRGVHVPISEGERARTRPAAELSRQPQGDAALHGAVDRIPAMAERRRPGGRHGPPLVARQGAAGALFLLAAEPLRGRRRLLLRAGHVVRGCPLQVHLRLLGPFELRSGDPAGLALGVGREGCRRPLLAGRRSALAGRLGHRRRGRAGRSHRPPGGLPADRGPAGSGGRGPGRPSRLDDGPAEPAQTGGGARDRGAAALRRPPGRDRPLSDPRRLLHHLQLRAERLAGDGGFHRLSHHRAGRHQLDEGRRVSGPAALL